jgi:hypothetical protein
MSACIAPGEVKRSRRKARRGRRGIRLGRRVRGEGVAHSVLSGDLPPLGFGGSDLTLSWWHLVDLQRGGGEITDSVVHITLKTGTHGLYKTPANSFNWVGSLALWGRETCDMGVDVLIYWRWHFDLRPQSTPCSAIDLWRISPASEAPVPSVKCLWEITWGFWMIVQIKLCRWRRIKSCVASKNKFYFT